MVLSVMVARGNMAKSGKCMSQHSVGFTLISIWVMLLALVDENSYDATFFCFQIISALEVGIMTAVSSIIS
jgi:hypothetical protein